MNLFTVHRLPPTWTVWCFSVMSDHYFDSLGFVYPRAPTSVPPSWTPHLWKLLLLFTHLKDEY